MALTVATLNGFPSANSALTGLTEGTGSYPGTGTVTITVGTPTDAATFSFTNNVYTQGSQQFVAGILDLEGVVPSRIFYANNGTGSGGNRGTQPLPTLFSVTRNVATDNIGNVLHLGYDVLLTPAQPGPDTGSPSGTVTDTRGASTTTEFPAEPILVQAYGYVAANPVSSYPQPTLKYRVSPSALLILASTQYG